MMKRVEFLMETWWKHCNVVNFLIRNDEGCPALVEGNKQGDEGRRIL